VRIVAEQSGGSSEAAEAWLAGLRRERRYQRDVY
jgi:sulfite reductase alpha subunit-like flavoprotein